MSKGIDSLHYIVDGQSPEEWEQILDCFDDANIYQTSAYARVCYGASNTSTLVIRKGNDPVGAALVRIRKVPGLPVGMAYVRWGPLWRRNGMNDFEYFAEGVRALMQEYVTRRGLILRIRPFLFEDETLPQYEYALRTEGYQPLTHWPRERTLIVDLKKPLDELRKGLNGKWRGHLNRAERNNMTIIEGTDGELFDQFQPIHEKLLEKESIHGIKSVGLFRKIQAQLPNELKMRVFLCEHHGEVCAGIIVSSTGKIGITLSRATSNLGRRLRAAYLVQWRALQWLKDEDCYCYDLSGVNKVTNPGTYSYKRGLCGRNGRELQMMHQFQVCRGRLTQAMMTLVDRGIMAIRRRRLTL